MSRSYSTNHRAHGSCMPKKEKKKTYQVRDHRERCRRVSAEYGTAEEDLNECLVRMEQLIRDTAGATRALS